MTNETPAAVLWDMDGTIVDTEPYWLDGERAMVESFGGTWTHADGMKLVGSGLWDSARILQDAGVRLSADEIVDRLTDGVLLRLRDELPWRPGALDLLTSVRDAGVPMALVTMSVERMARAIADAIPFDAFDVIIAGDMVDQPKPHPEAYLTAAARLGVDPTKCVAIEDSQPGLAAAVASGATVVGVPHVLPLPQSDAYVLWDTLQNRTVLDLSRLSVSA
ncbi:HAD family hydrolase [Planctomonas psychrotolerans]|uniref:HAD family hydrolase n=1 Tax=Planctomonas psychrotolerans TaxID=2528712 RepID=UPI00123AE924|nr:HAD family phosphatase [Planctomonas psychrotolerans]